MDTQHGTVEAIREHRERGEGCCPFCAHAELELRRRHGTADAVVIASSSKGKAA